MKKVITLTENDLIQLINRVIVEQNQATTKNIIDMPAFSKYKRNPEVKAFIEEFQNADANGRLTLINSKITGLKNKFPKTVEKINSLLGLAKSGKDVSCQCKDIKANIEQKMTAEKSFDPMFLILIVIILLVVFVGSGGPRSCAEQMGLS